MVPALLFGLLEKMEHQADGAASPPDPEEIIWQGAPVTGFVWEQSWGVKGPFLMIVLGIWTVSIWPKPGKSINLWLVLTSIVFAGGVLEIAPRHRRKRKNTQYQILKSHIVITSSWPSENIVTMSIAEFAPIAELRMHHSGIGTIYFGKPAPSLYLDGSSEIENPPSFERIPDAERVLTLIRSRGGRVYEG